MTSDGLSDMGYQAQLIAHLLGFAGPLTSNQIKQWVAESKYVDVTIVDILDQMESRGIIEQRDAGLWFLVEQEPPTGRIESFYVTFGVQYTKDPDRGEVHPLGMTRDNYVVIEAPNYLIAQRIANAVFDRKYAFIYDWEDFMGDGTYDRWYAENPEAHALTIKWVEPR